MGANNPQFSVPFNNTPLINGSATLGCMPNMQPSVSQPCYFNAPIHILPMQNTQLNMPLLQTAGSASYSGQFPVGFCPPNCVPNMFPMGMFPMNGFISNSVQNPNLINHPQPPGQLYMHNPMNPGQNFLQNANFPNRPLFFQNSNQSNNQVPMQINHGPVVPYSRPPCTGQTFGHLNQVTGTMGPQNPAIIANSPFMVHTNQVGQQVNQYQHNTNHGQHVPCNAPRPFPGPNNTLGHPNQVVQSMGPQSAAVIGNPPLGQQVYQGQHKSSAYQMDVNSSNQSQLFSQQLVNMPTAPSSGSVHPQQTQKNFQPLLDKGPQVHGLKDGRTNWGMPKSNSQHKQYPKGTLRHGKKGFKNDEAEKPDLGNITNQTRGGKKRSLSLNYTEQEIQLWREARRKNYPSKDNKLVHKLADSEIINQNAELRRQQLKEVLAKQAELGFEVAEIPSSYMLDSENKRDRNENNRDPSSKKGRFRNRHKRRERYDHQNDRFAKKQMANKSDSPNKPSLNQRNPTLLQKLLTADIKRDKSHLLQVFRFLVTNSFLKDWPRKPLAFPSVVVKESEIIGEVADDKFLLNGKGAFRCSTNTMVDGSDDVKTECDNIVADDKSLLLGKGASQFDDVETNARFEEAVYTVGAKDSNGEETGSSEEEGEITD